MEMESHVHSPAREQDAGISLSKRYSHLYPCDSHGISDLAWIRKTMQKVEAGFLETVAQSSSRDLPTPQKNVCAMEQDK